MLEMDGLTLRRIVQLGVKTKVVLASGYAEDAFREELEGQTHFAFLPKPFCVMLNE